MRLLQQLRAQHEFDLKVYQLAHNEPRNVLLHKLLIPVECWSALMFLWLIVDAFTSSINQNGTIINVLRLLPGTVTLLLGILSFMLVPTKIRLGSATFLFHIGVIHFSEALIQSYRYQYSSWGFPIFVLSSWVVAWILQVGVGHYLLEGNSPNVANMQDVSYLAMCQSVLIAWSM
ncbi:DUF962 domain containing protein [Nitzschia inconspicua]|uniref:DUF962 domain containing protein n=1 Tax=Nitzschia inconspicua TaxID=303405 RepID=A0A9K3KPX4_9STRA|nr:DUF962 domain containing protein [Nitzschia inconspicua]